MSQERSPLGEFEIRGEWWLPGNPDNRVPGLVYYKAGERVRLDLDKTLAEHWIEAGKGVRQYSPEPIPLEIVLGTGRDGTDVTVVDAYSLGIGGGIIASSLLIGRHFMTKQAIHLVAANLNFTHLEVWSEHSPTGAFFPPRPIGGEAEAPLQIQLPYRRKKLLDFEIASRACRIEIYSGIDMSFHTFRSLTLTHGILVYVEPSGPQGLVWYQRFFRDCTRLFSFLVGS